MPGPKQRPSRKAAPAAGGPRPAADNDDDSNGPAARRTGPAARPSRKAAGRRPSWDVSGALLNVAMALGAVSLAWFCWASYSRWRLTARLTTPLAAAPAVPEGASLPAASPDRFWGSYRPGVYFGMKTRSPRSPVAGLMWMEQTGAVGGGVGPLRHTCEQGDALPRYGWLAHDGRNFGVHEALDRDFSVRAAFVKRAGGAHGGDWSWRVTVKPRASSAETAPPLVSLLVYLATDGQGALRPRVEPGDRLAGVDGSSQELGDFRVTFGEPTAPKTNDAKYARYNNLLAPLDGLERVTEAVRASLSGRFVFGPGGGEERRYVVAVDGKRLGASEPGDAASMLVVHQLTARAPFQMEVLFESGSAARRAEPLSGAAFSRELAARQAAFDARFERTFGLADAKGFPPAQAAFAKAVLSNALGGVGYFHGRSVVRSPLTEGPVLYWPAPLLTAVPSRSFFPRGFLWDEGFHGLLVWRWDAEVARDILAHWLDLLNVDGWIPREQILGAEAQSKVPAEFVVQHSENANPPTFFLTLRASVPGLGDGTASDEDTAFLRRIFPRLRAWFEWYNSTQSGPVPHSFRWRGRDPDTSVFLNPKTLTSGLDDYPRASHPSERERHVDLRCWMTLAAGVMADIARTIGEPHQAYTRMHRELNDNEVLDALHWADELQAYADWGNHTEAVALVRERVPAAPGQQRGPPAPPQTRLVRTVRRAPAERFVNALGYVSLFPLLLGAVEADSARLPALLDLLADEGRVWTPFGLRSLSRADPLYQKRNTEHDPPYWRGAVWINLNYLAARALHRYARLPGPQRGRAGELYNALRDNVVGNVYRQYAATGYVWEQYSDTTGRGQGSHPFTGWTSLVVLMMAEEY